MDEKKAMTTEQNPEETGAKTFSQEEVNRIVGERLAKEKARGEATLAERERQLIKREMLLAAKEKINEMGLPAELVDVIDISSPETMEKALDTVKTVLDKYKAEVEARPVKFKGYKPAESLVREYGGGDSLREAMRLP